METEIITSKTEMDIITSISKSWNRRSWVRNQYEDEGVPYDDSLADYPEELLPFKSHSLYQELSEKSKSKIVTWAWINYNRKVILVEEDVINPGIQLLLDQKLPGVDDFNIQKVLRQTLVDEHFHMLLHGEAIEETRKLREISPIKGSIDSIFHRRLLERIGNTTEQWEKDILVFIWATVSEVSINAYLDLLSRNQRIQPNNANIALLHARDESAHNKVMVEISKLVYRKLSDRQKQFFIDNLPFALCAFVEPDFNAWLNILNGSGVEKASVIINDCISDSKRFDSKFDFSGISKLIHGLEIESKIDFDLS